MKVVVAHDYLTQRGGAERIALLFASSYEAQLYTAVYRSELTFPSFENIELRTSFLQQITSKLRCDVRYLALLLPLAWKSLRVDDADIVLASSSGWSHGISLSTKLPVIVYCHNPARWLYQPKDYLPNRAVRWASAPARVLLRAWDQRAARKVSLYLANSRSVASRIRAAYGVEPVVLYPPITIDSDGPTESIPGVAAGYWLIVSRPRGYKNTETAIRGILRVPGARLIVVGSRPPSTVDSSRVRYLNSVSDRQLRWLYSNAVGLLSISKEDFGLTPIEANAFGTPVAVLRAGGFLDSTIEGVSGVFIDNADEQSVAEAVESFPEFDSAAIREHAGQFSVSVFMSRIEQLLRQVHESESAELE